MRKWIVRAVVVVGMAATVSFVVTRSRERSIEYHTRKYLDALHGRTKYKLRELWFYITRQSFDVAERVLRDERQLESHQRALIKLGGLEERTFVISNGDVSDVMPFANPMFSPRAFVSSISPHWLRQERKSRDANLISTWPR